MEWSSQKASEALPITLIELLEEQAVTYGDRPLYSFLSRDLQVSDSVSFSGLYERAKECSAYLQKFYAKGDVLLLCFPFGLDFLVAFWASILAGCVPIPQARPRANNWQKIVETAKHADAKALLSNSAVRGLNAELFGVIDSFQIILINTVTGDASAWKKPQLSAQDYAFVQFTSGSSSAPKGVCVSHANIVNNLLSIRHNFECSDQDTTLSWLPFYHDMGLVGHVLQPLFSGMHNYFLSPMHFLADPCIWLRAIAKFGATISGAPNFAYEMCHSQVHESTVAGLDLSAWRLAYCGSEPVSALTARKFFATFAGNGFSPKAFQPCYGMAESTLFIASKPGLTQSRLDVADRSYVCVGNCEYSDIRVVDEKTLLECSDKTAGEVWVRSRSVVPHYFKEEWRTKELLGNRLGGESGYLRTGDLGFMFAGSLYLVGRSKNLIKQRGRSVCGEDIESAVRRTLDGELISRCVILQLEMKEYSVIVLLLETCTREPASVNESLISESAKQLLLREFDLRLEYVVFVRRGKLPLTTSGKPRREECKKTVIAQLKLV